VTVKQKQSESVETDQPAEQLHVEITQKLLANKDVQEELLLNL
jgi:hypothetical protein